MSKIRIAAGIGLLALLGLTVLYGIGYWPVHARGVRPPALVTQSPAKAAPAVAFGDGAGVRHALTAYRGKYVLLNLWATYCAPCVAELPALARLKADVPGLTVLAVDVGRDTPQAASDFLKGHKAESLGTYVDSNIALIAAFRAYGLPTTVLIDPDGKVIARAEGPAEWASPQAVAYFKELTGS